MPSLVTPATSPLEPEQDHTPRFSKFFSAAEDTMSAQSFIHNHVPTPAEETALTISHTRRRFAQGVPDDGKDDCAPLDRRAVLDIYAQALAKISEFPNKHTQIAAECTRKVRVVLALIDPKPCDPVFTTAGQLLKPLEPQYARPRILAVDDQYGYRAQWRLDAWRREGWPDRYPGQAVSREQSEKAEKLVGRNCLRNQEIRRRMVDDEEMWENGELLLEMAGKKVVEVKEGRASRSQTAKSRGLDEVAEKEKDRDLERKKELEEVLSEGMESWRYEEEDDDDGPMEFGDDDDWS
jgi:hypothetical protein